MTEKLIKLTPEQKIKQVNRQGSACRRGKDIA